MKIYFTISCFLALSPVIGESIEKRMLFFLNSIMNPSWFCFNVFTLSIYPSIMCRSEAVIRMQVLVYIMKGNILICFCTVRFCIIPSISQTIQWQLHGIVCHETFMESLKKPLRKPWKRCGMCWLLLWGKEVLNIVKI